MADNNPQQLQLPDDVLEKLQAGAFQSLIQHLQQRSDEVQNIDLMTLSGFCRNCLAKWMVVEARNIVDTKSDEAAISQDIQNLLNNFGYDEAAKIVYGTSYNEWKKRYQKKATSEQMQKYEASQSLHAKHDKSILEKRPTASTTSKAGFGSSGSTSAKGGGSSLRSNVCCEDVNTTTTTTTTTVATSNIKSRSTIVGQPYVPPPIPTNLSSNVKVGILTVSDRASKNEYETGDLSGPAVRDAILSQLLVGAENKKNSVVDTIKNNISTAIVPDDIGAIKSQIRTWCESQNNTMDIILTTGGTGMSVRDVTPEATRSVVDIECVGLMNFVTTECSRLHQPLSCLSRGTAGIICHKNNNSSNQTIIANLPGNPKGVTEIIPILFPLLLNAVSDLKKQEEK